MLGDSDSHSYHDELKSIDRGGAWRKTTFNWLTVWAQLRPEEIDPGEMKVFGDGRFLASVKAAFGKPSRVPAKRDFEYNYAFSGARCASLVEQWPQQVNWLGVRLKAAPEKWNDGLVVIRIGVNDFGQREHVRRWAEAAHADEAAQRISECISAISRSVDVIRAHSTARIALVGIAREYNAPDTYREWEDEADVARIAAVLETFDTGLRDIAAGDPRIAFVDDITWFMARYGDRARGDWRPTYTSAGVTISNTWGDEPHNLVLSDDHAGTVAGGFFANHLIGSLNAAFDLKLTPLTEAEMLELAGLTPED